jgi:hypothetical protein
VWVGNELVVKGGLMDKVTHEHVREMMLRASARTVGDDGGGCAACALGRAVTLSCPCESAPAAALAGNAVAAGGWARGCATVTGAR